jgi:hypothetical protein
MVLFLSRRSVLLQTLVTLLSNVFLDPVNASLPTLFPVLLMLKLVVPENVIKQITHVSTTFAHLLHHLDVLLSVPTLFVKPTNVKSLEPPPSVLVLLSVIVPKKSSTPVKSMKDVVLLLPFLDVKLEPETVPKNLKMERLPSLNPLENVVSSSKTQPTLTAVFFKPRPAQTMIHVLLFPVILLMVSVNQDLLDVLPPILVSQSSVPQLDVKKPCCALQELIPPPVPPDNVLLTLLL